MPHAIQFVSIIVASIGVKQVFTRVGMRSRRYAGQLSTAQTDLLKRVYAARETVTELDYDRAADIFDDVRTAEEWFGCDCQGLIPNRPLLCTVAQSTIRRMQVSNHAPECAFNRGTERGPAGFEPTRSPPQNDLLVLGNYPEPPGGSQEFTPRAGGNETARQSRLSQVLFHIIERAGVNTIGCEVDLSEPRDHPRIVYRASYNLPMYRVGGEVTWLHEKLLTSARKFTAEEAMTRFKYRIERGAQPSNARPQGFFIGLATGYEPANEHHPYQLMMPEWDIPIKLVNAPRFFGEDSSQRRFPCLAIVAFARRTPGANQIEPVRAYLQPCESESSWLPLDSDAERVTLKGLVAWRKKHVGNHRITIKKPLFNVVQDDLSCRPDFIVTLHARDAAQDINIAVETIGLRDDDYRARKQRTHAIMRRFYDGLLCHDMTLRDPIRDQVQIERVSTALDTAFEPYLLERPPG